MASKPFDPQKKPRRGCWTCKDRRVSCDRQVPSCLNCVRSNRKCLGYGIRLSWPRSSDPKRAMVAISKQLSLPAQGDAKRHSQGLKLIHTSSRDMEMYHYLRESRRRAYRRQPTHFTFSPPPLPWSSANPDPKALDLLGHFVNVSYSTLSVLGVDHGHLRSLLIRMTLSSSGLPALALMASLLAVSSLHRDGLQDMAFQYKIAALNALAKSAQSGPHGTLESAQHAATLMLLATFENQHHSESSGQWIFYVEGAKHIVQTTGLHERSDLPDLNLLLDWISYLDIMSCFIMRHWHHTSTLPHSTRDKIAPKTRQSREKPPLLLNRANSSIQVLNTVAAVFDIPFEPRGPQAQTEEYQSRLGSLEATLLSKLTPGSTVTESNSEDDIVLELYQLAALVYLLHGSASPGTQDARLAALINRGFNLIQNLKTCERSFPLLVLGSEARTDEERMDLLELIRRTEARHNACNLMRLGVALTMIWSQRDLEADEDDYSDQGYFHRMDTIISSACTLPLFS